MTGFHVNTEEACIGKGPFWLRTPDHRVRAEQLRQLRRRALRRANAVPAALAERPYRDRPAVGPRPAGWRRDAPAAVSRPRKLRLVSRHRRRRLPEHLLPRRD